MKEKEQPEPLSQHSAAASTGKVASRTSLLTSESSGTEPPNFRFQSANDSPRSVDLHIDELVLNGFAPADRYAIGEAVERELNRLFTERGTPASIARDVEITSLNGGAINVKPGHNADATGNQLARAIYDGLCQ